MSALFPRPAMIALALLAPLTIGAARDSVPEATPAGKPVSCIPIRSIQQSQVRSNRVIDFEVIGHKTYRNTLPYDCPGLGFEERFSYTTSLSQLCSNDIITVFYTSPVSRGASCGLGQFQPVTLAKRR